MITIERDGVYYLLIIGGVGSKLTTMQVPQTSYIELPGRKWRTNEHSMYCLSTGKTITT